MTEDRNSPRDIVFDMEDDIGDLRRLGSTLLLISTTDGLEDAVQDAVHHVASGILLCHRDLHDKFTRMFDQIVWEKGDKPEPAKGFDAIFAAWNAHRRQPQDVQDVSDEEGERLDEQEEALLDKIATTPTTSAGEIAAKVLVAKELIEQHGSRWGDARDVKVLDSVMEDLTRLGAGEGGQP